MNTTIKESKIPVAKKKTEELSIHNHTRIDNYYWLNDKENPEVIAYVEEENTHTDQMTKHLDGFKEELFQEIKGRIKEKDESVPYQLNDYFYYYRYEEGQEYAIHCRKKGSLEAEEEILLDVNQLAEGESYFQVTGLSISKNDNILSFATDNIGRRQYTIRFKDLESGEVLPDTIELTSGSVVWANDNKTIFYTTKDEQTLRDDKVFKHRLGTETSKDELVYHEEDETFHLGISKTKSRKYILIESHSTLSTEVQYLEAVSPEGTFQVIEPRKRDHEYNVDHYQDEFYIITNDQAKNFRLMKTPVSNTAKENWQEVIPHREDVLLEGSEIFKDYLILQERQNGLTEIRIIHWESKDEYYLDFGEATYTAYIGFNPEFDTQILRFHYNSLTTPSSVFDYNLSDKSKTLKKQQQVLGVFDASHYQSERIYAISEDGTKVPISLVYKKGMNKDSSNPLYLTAYGSYGLSYDPYFSSVRLSLLDRGFVFAIAHIRGGEEMGRHWYENGKLLKKKNTFADFIACAQFLIQEKFTSSEKLVVSGGSAGGLLMGAVVNSRPNLFKIVVADVPFVDVVTTMLDDSIPLTTGEYDEWGNPNDKQYYDYILSYSPYDQVEAKEYPHMLITSGLHDSQVQYWEPTKWAAKLRALKTDNNILLLKTNMDAGHGGASGRFSRLKEIAFEYAFILDLLGMIH